MNKKEIFATGNRERFKYFTSSHPIYEWKIYLCERSDLLEGDIELNFLLFFHIFLPIIKNSYLFSLLQVKMPEKIYVLFFFCFFFYDRNCCYYQWQGIEITNGKYRLLVRQIFTVVFIVCVCGRYFHLFILFYFLFVISPLLFGKKTRSKQQTCLKWQHLAHNMEGLLCYLLHLMPHVYDSRKKKFFMCVIFFPFTYVR